MAVTAEDPKALYIPVTEAARQLGVSYWTVYRLYKDGVLKGIRLRNVLRISLESLNRYLDDLHHQQD